MTEHLTNRPGHPIRIYLNRPLLGLQCIEEREGLFASEGEVEAGIGRYAEALEKSPAALRAQLSKDGTLDRMRGRIRREKAVDFIKQHAKLH